MKSSRPATSILFLSSAVALFACSGSPQDPERNEEEGPDGSGGAASSAGGALPENTGGVSHQSSGGAEGDGTGGGSTGGGTSASGGDTGAGGTVTYSTNREDFGLGQGSLCDGADLELCVSFETTDVGALPQGFTLSGYGTRTVGTTDAIAARGSRSLQIDIPGAQSAVVAMLTHADLGTLGEAHYGRMFYRILGPGPSQFIHFDVFEGTGPWMGHENAVRFASTGTGVGTSASNWSWIYNVQPFGEGAGPEFGTEGDRSVHPRVDEWMCLEWEFDSGEQTAIYFHDGAVIDDLVIDTERAEIPVFSSVAFGLQKFQNTDALRVFVDEFALDRARIGCNY